MELPRRRLSPSAVRRNLLACDPRQRWRHLLPGPERSLVRRPEVVHAEDALLSPDLARWPELARLPDLGLRPGHRSRGLRQRRWHFAVRDERARWTDDARQRHQCLRLLQHGADNVWRDSDPASGSDRGADDHWQSGGRANAHDVERLLDRQPNLVRLPMARLRRSGRPVHEYRRRRIEQLRSRDHRCGAHNPRVGHRFQRRRLRFSRLDSDGYRVVAAVAIEHRCTGHHRPGGSGPDAHHDQRLMDQQPDVICLPVARLR